MRTLSFAKNCTRNYDLLGMIKLGKMGHISLAQAGCIAIARLIVLKRAFRLIKTSKVMQTYSSLREEILQKLVFRGWIKY